MKNFDLKNKTAYVYGKLEPSTELQMHHIIYKSKKNVNAVFHLHDYSVMKKAKKLGIPITDVAEAGTEKIGYDVVDKLKKSDYVIMKKHGVVAVGKNIKETWKLILRYNKFALE